jgi:hypothetical protein
MARGLAGELLTLGADIAVAPRVVTKVLDSEATFLGAMVRLVPLLGGKARVALAEVVVGNVGIDPVLLAGF